MLLITLLLIPLIGIFIISTISVIPSREIETYGGHRVVRTFSISPLKQIKKIALSTSIINLAVSLIVFLLFNFSSNQFQFVQEYHRISSFDFYLGVDGISIYFVLLTTVIMPIALLSNWNSISENEKSYVIIILLLETLLLAVFLVLDILLFYIFFATISTMYILCNLFIYKLSFSLKEKLKVLCIVFITVLPLKIIFFIFSLHDYYFIIVVLSSLFSITFVFIYQKGILPDLHNILIAITLSVLSFIFIYPLLSYCLHTILIKSKIIFLSNVLLTQGVTFNSNASNSNASNSNASNSNASNSNASNSNASNSNASNSNASNSNASNSNASNSNASNNTQPFDSEVEALNSAIENTPELNANDIPNLKRELSLLNQKGRRALIKIRNFYAKGSPIERAIEINNEKIVKARQIDILSGNSKCLDNHKKSDLYRYVVSLNNKKK